MKSQHIRTLGLIVGLVAALGMAGITAGQLEESARFAASDGAGGDQFGTSLGISSGVGLVGAPSDDDNGTDSGAAYTSTTDANGVVTSTKLLASDGAAGDAFGSAVAIHKNFLVVGAPTPGGAGAAYVFVRQGTRWVQKAKLVAKDGVVGDAFGSSVSVDGKTVVVGAPGKNGSTGAAYVFKKKGRQVAPCTEAGRLRRPREGLFRPGRGCFLDNGGRRGPVR